MIPAIYHLPDLYIGDSYPSFSLSFSDENGTPIDLTGGNISLHVKIRAAGPVFLEWSTASGTVQITGGDNNTIVFLQKGPEETKNLFSGLYNYDLEINKDGITKTYLRGNIKLLDDFTKV